MTERPPKAETVNDLALKTGLYLHFPFCVKKCNYCAFLSFDAEGSPRKEYTEAMIKEIETRGLFFNHEREIDSVYLGGGTPSVMDVSQLSLIMKAVRKNFDIKSDAEITIEANPGTLGKTDRVTRTKLQAYRFMGVNRLSMVVQSMNNDRLHLLGRIHTAEDVIRDFRMAREAGFDNINLDLIFSVPGETTEDALKDAEAIIALGPEHISCYSLQLEEGTPFYEMADQGLITEVDDEEDRRIYHEICSLLKKSGYEHYEISNFARLADEDIGKDPDAVSPFRSIHNSGYWDMSDYMGIGLGASGFISRIRYRNTPDLNEYLTFFREHDPADIYISDIPSAEYHINSEFDMLSEKVFTGLRRREGIKYSETGLTEEEFWRVFSYGRKEAERFSEQGLLIIDKEGLRLTEKGIDISNSIMAEFV